MTTDEKWKALKGARELHELSKQASWEPERFAYMLEFAARIGGSRRLVLKALRDLLTEALNDGE